MFALCVNDVADGVDSTIEEATQTEDDVPPMYGAYHRDVQKTIVGNSIWQLLDTTTVELAHTDSDAKEQVVVYQLVVDPHLRTRGAVCEEGAYQAPEVTTTAEVTLGLACERAAYDRSIEAQACNIGHIAHLAHLRLLVTHLRDILKKGVALLDGAYGLGVARRDAEHTYPVVARTRRYHRNGNLGGLNTLLDEYAVDNLVECAIATYNDDMSVATLYRRHGEFGGVVLMLGEDSLVAYAIIAQ